MAFPAIHKLELNFRESDLEPALLASLQNCSNLSSLTLKAFRLPEGAASPAAAALAQLSGLKELSLIPRDYDDLGAASLAQQMSGLTALWMDGYYTDGFHSAIVKAAAHNPNLQDLQVGHEDGEGPTAAQLAALLAACPALTVLNLELAWLDDEGLEVLLTHGSNITSLNLSSFELQSSFAERACRWKTVKLGLADALVLARLPLRTVTQLTIGSPNSPLELDLPLGEVPDAQLPAILHQAATNMASCPAWQAGSKSQISLLGYPGPIPKPEDTLTVFDGEQRIQLFEALAPLGGPAVKEVEVSIKGATFQWGRPEVQALARSLGGQVTSLLLSYCSLQSDFWVALDECFPALTSLHMELRVTCSAPHVALFCGARAAGRPFTLRLKATADFWGVEGVYSAVQGEQLQAGLEAMGMAHVSVVRV
jgi:hypothetical protein